LQNNLTQDTTEKDIQSIVEEYGELKNVYLFKQVHIAFIEFETQESANELINLQKSQSISTEIEFSFSGIEKFACSKIPNKDDSNNIMLTISNTNIPIDVNMFSQIFGKFVKIHEINNFLQSFGSQVVLEICEIQHDE
jgi:RNA recognition motif-containing protein